MRRRRKTKYNWLPTLGRGTVVGAITPPTFNAMVLAVDAQDRETVGVQAIVENAIPVQTGEVNFPLNDIIGNEYVLKRVVGKIFVGLQWAADTTGLDIITQTPVVVVSAGIFVARLDPTNPEFSPVDITDGDRLYAPLNRALIREPWVWRRTWLLGSGVPLDLHSLFTDETAFGVWPAGITPPYYPATNIEYGSVLDGPHVDAKTGRRVRQDEGLFLAVGARYRDQAYDPVASQLQAQVQVLSDFRCLGALRRAKNRSNF